MIKVKIKEVLGRIKIVNYEKFWEIWILVVTVE